MLRLSRPLLRLFPGKASRWYVGWLRQDTYTFPRHRFPTKMRDERKTPLVVVACGSFSPPTYLHLCVPKLTQAHV